MSNTIRFDAVLLQALAAELERTFSGRRVRRAALDRTRALLLLELGERGAADTLLWSLSPAAPRVAVLEGRQAGRTGRLQLPRDARLSAITVPADERIVRLELASAENSPGLVHSIVLELIGTRWNALALGGAERLLAVLHGRREAGRELRPGVPYRPPAPAGGQASERAVPDAAGWLALLAGVAPAARRKALFAAAAYASPINVAYILGDAALHDDERLLAGAYERYREVVSEAVRQGGRGAFLLPGGQPYPHPLGTAAEPCPSLLSAFQLAALQAGRAEPTGLEALRATALARVEDDACRLEVRLGQLREAAETGRQEAAALRARADLLMAQLWRVPRGAEQTELDDFQGGTAAVELDASLSPQQNAQQWYEQARRRERAAERLPAIRARLERELARLAELRQRLERDELPPEELERLGAAQEPGVQPVALPFRRYRSSGGLELRVGRSARANDELTFRHSSPDDIWLHARDVAGAHVIIRWSQREQNPPARDLTEAAILAALHSRSRTAGVVAVDWTRRKYVRKPRKAAPGAVIPERVKTLFVEPSREVEERLREPD